MEQTKNPAAVALGKLGGLTKSPARAAASRENGKLGGRPKKYKDEEVWKDIEGYHGTYKISSHGRVLSLRDPDNPIIRKTSRSASGKGYPQVHISSTEIGNKHYSVHRLVAQYFVPNPDNKNVVNHKDGNKLNAHYSNLEWCTHTENSKHALENGMTQLGEDHHHSYLTEEIVLDIRKRRAAGEKLQDVADSHGVSKKLASRVALGRRWGWLPGSVPPTPSGFKPKQHEKVS